MTKWKDCPTSYPGPAVSLNLGGMTHFSSEDMLGGESRESVNISRHEFDVFVNLCH